MIISVAQSVMKTLWQDLASLTGVADLLANSEKSLKRRCV